MLPCFAAAGAPCQQHLPQSTRPGASAPPHALHGLLLAAAPADAADVLLHAAEACGGKPGGPNHTGVSLWVDLLESKTACAVPARSLGVADQRPAPPIQGEISSLYML